MVNATPIFVPLHAHILRSAKTSARCRVSPWGGVCGRTALLCPSHFATIENIAWLWVALPHLFRVFHLCDQWVLSEPKNEAAGT